ncbi:DUF3039 domain-containing protein [Saccharopolyspora pogona]|uniref:DUF3039 domain-containing protein n=1 Tax=Saccharopolyspora pogona TaxID=333966 RepID=UPI001687058C|nr:DUF3039 domain-containing protein [Saccharopolyspora pogona]
MADTTGTEQPRTNGQTGLLHTGAESAPAFWIAVCGDRLAPGDAELVETYGGTPCTTCYLALISASAIASVGRTEEFSPPVIEMPSESGFAISWRERLVHRVTVDSPRKEFGGRQIVAGLCGHLGWGPVENAPTRWPVCTECDEIAAENEKT